MAAIAKDSGNVRRRRRIDPAEMVMSPLMVTRTPAPWHAQQRDEQRRLFLSPMHRPHSAPLDKIIQGQYSTTSTASPHKDNRLRVAPWLTRPTKPAALQNSGRTIWISPFTISQSPPHSAQKEVSDQLQSNVLVEATSDHENVYQSSVASASSPCIHAACCSSPGQAKEDQGRQ